MKKRVNEVFKRSEIKKFFFVLIFKNSTNLKVKNENLVLSEKEMKANEEEYKNYYTKTTRWQTI